MYIKRNNRINHNDTIHLVSIVLLWSCALILLSGCAEQKYVQTRNLLCIPAETEPKAITVAEEVLSEMHFEIAKSDIDAGLIKTHPLSGAQTFEIWRADSVGLFNRTEADLHNIRRTVELNITEQSGQLCIKCNAITERLSLPADQTAIVRGRMAMAAGHGSPQNLKLKENVTWINLGNDNQLETEIINRISKRIARGKGKNQ